MMTTEITSESISPSISHTSIDELIARAGDLKSELVAFAQAPRFARPLDALPFETANRHGYLDEATAVIDRFALQHRLSDGRTVVERFVEQRRPRLLDDDRAMVLSWRDVVETHFEIQLLDRVAVERTTFSTISSTASIPT